MNVSGARVVHYGAKQTIHEMTRRNYEVNLSIRVCSYGVVDLVEDPGRWLGHADARQVCHYFLENELLCTRLGHADAR